MLSEKQHTILVINFTDHKVDPPPHVTLDPRPAPCDIFRVTENGAGLRTRLGLARESQTDGLLVKESGTAVKRVLRSR